MLKDMLEYAGGHVDLRSSSGSLSTLLDVSAFLQSPLGHEGIELPIRLEDTGLEDVSFVLQNPLQCYMNSPGKVNTEKLDEQAVTGRKFEGEVIASEVDKGMDHEIRADPLDANLEVQNGRDVGIGDGFHFEEDENR